MGKEHANRHEQNRGYAQHGKGRVHNLVGPLYPLFFLCGWKNRGTAAAEQIREGTDNNNQRKTKSYCAECRRSHLGNAGYRHGLRCYIRGLKSGATSIGSAAARIFFADTTIFKINLFHCDIISFFFLHSSITICLIYVKYRLHIIYNRKTI